MSDPVPAAAEERTVAAVDLGSNSFHMKVARLRGDQLVVVDRVREMVQLAAGLSDDDELSEEAAERAIACLQRFEERLRGIPAEDIRAVGTNTLRRANNSRDFLTRAEAALDHHIEIIAGREEARLIYLGVMHEVAQDEEQRLVVDIGGGSTELVVGRRFTSILTESLYMGCVGMSKEHFPDGRITGKAMKAAVTAARQELEPIHAAYRRVGWNEALGSSGTILTIERLIAAQGLEERGITLAAMQKLREMFVQAGSVSELSLPDVRPSRAAVLPGGLAVLIGVFEALRVERMIGSPGALREGLLHDLVGRLEHVDARESTIRDLCERYKVDMEQAGRVEQTALLIRAQVAQSWKLRKPRYGNLLSWGARLHELGLAIAHNQYHKHGAYVLLHADLPGFSRDEQMLLGLLVRAHRRKFPLREFEPLRGTLVERARRMAIILRLAVVLHRSRLSEPLPSIVVEADADRLHLGFPEGWLAEQPLTEADLAQEASYLRTAGVSLEVG